MAKKVKSGRLFDVLNIPGIPQCGPALPPLNVTLKEFKMNLEDNGMLTLTWVSDNKKNTAVIGVSMIKHLSLEPESIG